MKLISQVICSGLLAFTMATSASAEERPNFLVILVDDAAFMDLEPYGGEANMPNVSALAARGTMFTNYHTSPLCAPSRAMLLTGLDNHQTGVSTIPEVLPPELENQAGYTMALEPGVTTIAERLRDAGYRTLMSGKWHLGHGEGDLPVDHGFDRSFTLDASGADNWEHLPYMPFYHEAPWFEDGEPVHELPEDFYSSEFLVDRMIQYLDETDESGQPFFAYLPFQAIHIPVQAPREFTDRYDGIYDEGWHVLREARHARAIELGLVPAGTEIAPAPEALRQWDDLSDDLRARYIRSMQVNAGMLEAMDHHIGRLLAHLEASGQLENTVVIITSDNGPEFNHPPMTHETIADYPMRNFIGWQIWLRRHGYNWNLETMGERSSYAFIGSEWAFAASSPFDLFKFYGSEGGLRVPLIMSGPGLPEGARHDGMSFVSDITPTIVELAGLAVNDTEYYGRSLRSAIAGDAPSAYGANDSVGMEVSGNSALFRGGLEDNAQSGPWGDGQWRLYNLAQDPGETRDLREEQPDIYAEMLGAYAAYEAQVGVLPLPDGYDSVAQVSINSLAKQGNYLRNLMLAVIAAFLLLLIVLVRLIWRFVRR